MRINIGGMLANRAFLSPGLEGFSEEGYRFTYEQVNARVNQFAAYLKEQAIAEGDRVAVLCKNNQYFATAFFAAAKAGAVTVPLNWRLQAQELLYIVRDSGAAMLIYDAEFGETVEKLKPAAGIRVYVQAGGIGPDLWTRCRGMPPGKY